MAAKQQLKSSKDSSLQRLISLIIHTVRTGMNAHLCPSLADLWSSGSRLSSFPLPWWSVVTFLTLCKEKEKERWVTIVLLQKKKTRCHAELLIKAEFPLQCQHKARGASSEHEARLRFPSCHTYSAWLLSLFMSSLTQHIQTAKCKYWCRVSTRQTWDVTGPRKSTTKKWNPFP